jgi:hypothetical protein
MTTPDNNQNIGKLERVLEGIQRKVGDIGAMMHGMNEKMNELGEIADSIYDSLASQRASAIYGRDSEDLFD